MNVTTASHSPHREFMPLPAGEIHEEHSHSSSWAGVDNGTQSNCPLTAPPLGGQFAGSGNEIDLSLPLGHEKLILSRLSSVSFYYVLLLLGCTYWDTLSLIIIPTAYIYNY